MDALQRTKLDSLQALRAVAALLVVLFHVGFVHTVGPWPFRGIFADGSRGVDLFFVLSGFIITWIHAGDWGKPHRAASYLFNRVRRIYPSVWIMTLFAIAIYAVGFGGADRAGKLALWNVIATALLLPQKEISLVSVTWSLKYEIFFYLVFLLTILDRRTGFIVLGLWQAAILVVTVARVPYQDLWFGFYLRPICLEFGVGILCAWLLMRRRDLRLGAPAMQWALLLAGSVAFVVAMAYETYPLGHAPRLPDMVFGVSAGAILTSLVMLEAAGRLRVRGWLVRLGDASYAVYLVHFSVISALLTVAVKLHRVPLNDAACLLFGAIAVGAGIAFDHFVDRPIQVRLRQLKQGVVSSSAVGAS